MVLSNFPNGVSSFGIPQLGNGDIPTAGGEHFFVHSGRGNNGYSGDFDTPFATIDYAVSRCTANKGSVIVVLPGHAETLITAAACGLDVAGVTVLGLGSGTDMPEVTFGTAAAASISITAANVTVNGIRFKCAIANMTAGIDVNSTDFIIENCEFHESSATGLVWIDINGGGANACDRAKIRDNRFYCTTAGNWDRAIELGEVADAVEIVNNIIVGDFDDAAIHNITGKVMTNLLISQNYVRNNQAGQHAIELVSACTGTAFGNRLVTDAIATGFDAGALSCMDNLWNITTGGDSEGVPVNPTGDAATNYIGTNNADNATVTSSVVANEDGSVLERLEQLQKAVNNGSGTAIATNKSLIDIFGSTGSATADSAVSLVGIIGSNTATTAFASGNVVADEDGNVLERLELLQTGIIKGAGTAVGAAKSLVDCLGTNGLATADSAVSLVGIIGSDTATTAFASTNVIPNHDGNVLERLEALAQQTAARNPGYGNPNYFVVTADMTSATWKTAASHQIAAVTGMVRLLIIPQCTATLTDAADLAVIQLGITGTTDAIIAATDAAGKAGNTISTNEFWADATPADVVLTQSQVNALTVVVGGGIDVGYEITGAALTGGTLLFHCWWSPMDATGAVAAGNGAALA